MMVKSPTSGVRGAPALPGNCGVRGDECGVRGAPALPTRKQLDHRGPLSVDVSGAWYFITICAKGHRPWVMTRNGRAGAPRTPPSFAEIANVILQHACEYQQLGKWKISLFLVMPDHLHFIMHVPQCECGLGVAFTLARVIANWKHWLAARYGISFQENFWDTRLRDDAHYDEKFKYICNNPVRKDLCRTAREWAHVVAFDRATGEGRVHR